MIAALRLEWIVNRVKRSLRDVMFLVVPIRGLKPTATIISHYVTQATVASRQRILAVGFNPRKGFIHGLRRVATADDDLVGSRVPRDRRMFRVVTLSRQSKH